MCEFQLAQTTMRSEIGKIPLDNVFKEREALNYSIVQSISKAAEPWGIVCLRYEIRTYVFFVPVSTRPNLSNLLNVFELTFILVFLHVFNGFSALLRVGVTVFLPSRTFIFLGFTVNL